VGDRWRQLGGAAGIPVASATRAYWVALLTEVVDDSPHRRPGYTERGADLLAGDRVVLVSSPQPAQNGSGVGVNGGLMV
tara:strand:+ start:1739 stop:1975 length:237 start_codon:yes stop_codon:yes gene_type:complete